MAESFPPIDWRVHFRSSPAAVWNAWTTDAGRESFWARKSRPLHEGFALEFINGDTLAIHVYEATEPSRLVFGYFGDSRVTVELAGDDDSGCDLRLVEKAVPPAEHLENYAGWVSVLLTCKAAVDFGIDLRSHDPRRTWNGRYVDV